MSDKIIHKRRVLIADDDRLFCTVATACLMKAGFETATAENGAEAMDKLLSQRFDIAIVDLVMPQIDGLRLIALIRATGRIRRLPILIVTSQQDPDLQAEGIRVGANDCLTKPVNWLKFPAKVNEVLGR